MADRSKQSKKSAATKSPATKAAQRLTKPVLVSSKLAFKGRVFSVYTDTILEPNGHKHTKDVIRHNGSVVILAVDESMDPADPEIILERQYRHSIGQNLIELPAGKIEEGEAPLAAAKREMIEETGYRAKKWKLLAKFFPSPGFIGEWMQIYLATGISAGAAQPEADEVIEIQRMKLSQALALVAEGKILDGKTIIGLSRYDAARRAGKL